MEKGMIMTVVRAICSEENYHYLLVVDGRSKCGEEDDEECIHDSYLVDQAVDGRTKCGEKDDHDIYNQVTDERNNIVKWNDPDSNTVLTKLLMGETILYIE